MDEIALIGNVWDRDDSPKKKRLSKQCKACGNFKEICRYHTIPIGSRQYKETAPWGKCKWFLEVKDAN